MATMTGYDADVARAMALLTDGDGSAHAAADAVVVARACVALDAKRVDAYVVLARALMKNRQCDEAVKICKKALTLHPGNAQLEEELRAARFAVLNDLPSDDDEEQDDDTHTSYSYTAPLSPSPISEAFGRTSGGVNGDDRSQPSDTTAAVTSTDGSARDVTFEAKVERLLLHLDLNKLVRVGLWYTLLELVQLRCITAGLVALFLGILVQAAVHRHKFMVISMLFVGLAHSKLRIKGEEYLRKWINTSSDKLGAVVWLPRVAMALPIVLKVFGQLKFMLFLQRDVVLMVVVTLTTGACAAMAMAVSDGTHPLRAWGYGKRLKFVAYATAIAYWALWCGNYADTLRLVGPALMDAGGILLSSASSSEIQSVCRRAWKRVFDEVSADVQQEIDFDAWFFMGLTNWIIDYWQQPTDFSLEMLAKWLAEGFASFESHAVYLFRPELQRLSAQMRRIGRDAELTLLVAYLKQSLESVPPRQWLGCAGLFAKRCSSFVVALLLVVFYGTLVMPPLIPFLVSEFVDARALMELFRSEELKPMDGLDVLLLGSPLLRVWANAKAAVYCLEGGVALSKAMATGAQILTAAARLSQLATFAAKVKSAGFAAHADEIPEHLTNAFVVLSDYRTIAQGLQHVLYESTHVRDVGQSLRRWWSGKDA